MKKIGIIGGLSWYSSVDYYRHLNELYQAATSKDNSASIVLNSLNLETVNSLFKTPRKALKYLANEAKILDDAGCEIILIASNTVHAAFPSIDGACKAKCIHIADACAAKINAGGFKKVALLGTKYSLEKDFLTGQLEKHDFELIIPETSDRIMMQKIISEELTVGIFSDESRLYFCNLIEKLEQQNVDACIMACTEIPILLKDENFTLTLIDSALEHCKLAIESALQN